MTKETWYQEKELRFKCTGCGKCCTGTPGYVWVNEEEIEEIARFLKLTPKDIKQRYTRRLGTRLSLTELKPHFSCVFLKDNKCQVYGARPTQCRTYPFWPQNLSSEEAWEAEAKNCEGISETAPKVPIEVIEEQHFIQIGRNKEPSNS